MYSPDQNSNNILFEMISAFTRVKFITFFSINIMTISAGFIALFGCSSGKPPMQKNQIISDPLVIHWEIRETALHAWHSLGGKPGYKNATSYFSIKHKGNTVTIPSRNMEVTYFSQALFLKDAPKPAILAGTHRMYLITDDNGKANIKLLDAGDGDYGKFQWLDSENGQPGKQEKVYQIDNSKSSRFLSGGRYLLVNTRMLLDVETLITYPIDNNSTELINQLEGFNAFNSEVICLSPGKTQIVLKAYRRNPVTNLTDYALVAIDFSKNQAYAVPFDRTKTRLTSIQNATSSWVSTYFDWKTNQEGKEVLSLHLFEKLPYWKGTFNLHPKTDEPAQYQVKPVLPEMTSHFMQCIKQQYPTTVIQGTRETSHLIMTEFTINGKPMTLYANLKEKSLTLLDADKLMVKTIGEQFEQELAEGRFQDSFGQIVIN